MSSIKLMCDAASWLDQPVSSVPVKKIGWFAKRALLRGSPLKGEDVHEGPSAEWFDLFCPTMIGSIKGTIYKVAVTVTALRIDPDSLIPTVSAEISRLLQVDGATAADGVMVWDADDGNVVMQPVRDSVPSEVIIFLTSNIARSFF